MDSADNFAKHSIEGQLDLFSGESESGQSEIKFKAEEEFRHADILCFEKYATGMYISGHPLDPYIKYIRLMKISDSSYYEEEFEKGSLKKNITNGFIGAVDDVTVRYTSTGKKMAFVNLQDTVGSINVTFFPETYKKYENKLEYGSVVYVKGKISAKSSGSLSLICDNLFDEEEFNSIIESKRLCIKINSAEKEIFSKLVTIMPEYPGKREVCFYVTDLKKYVRPKNIIGINLTEELIERLISTVGCDKIGLID